LKGKPSFHLKLRHERVPECDCWGHNDAAIVPDLGILASADPVALDRASFDLVNAAPALAGGVAFGGKGGDHFMTVHPGIDGRLGLAYAESIGLGTEDYELVRL